MDSAEPTPRSLASAYRDAAFGPQWRLYWVKAVVACGMLSGMLLSQKLWLSERTYPHCPVADWLPSVPPPLDTTWFRTLLALLAGIAVVPRSRWRIRTIVGSMSLTTVHNCLIAAFVGLAALLSLWDQSRWQPWFYQYLFMLAAFAFTKDEQPLAACRFIMAATYFWSGVQKFNARFVSETLPWLLTPFLAPELSKEVASWGWAVSFIEAGIGLGLLIPRTRLVAVFAVLGMHASLLYCLGPFGHNWNSVVWPWNITMMALAVILFWQTPNVSVRDILRPATVHGCVVVLLFGVMPAFNFVGLWDSYLSAALYSGNTVDADILVSEEVYAKAPAPVQKHIYWNGEHYEVWLQSWSIEEMNVPPYPARRVFRKIARGFCEHGQDPSEVILQINEPPHWRTGKRTQVREDCRDW